MDRNDAALDFLASRRSTPPKVLKGPAPDRADVTRLLTMATRVPDHGALTPWRFVVLTEPALRRLAGQIVETGEAEGRDPAALAKARAVYDTSPLAIAVISSPGDTDRIPLVEQRSSAAGVCLELLNAALASGWAAGWVTGWAAHDRAFLPAFLGLKPDEQIVGMVHVGSGKTPPDRPRPDVEAITDWRD